MRRFLLFLAAIGGIAWPLRGANVVVDGTMGKVEPLTGPNIQITEDFGFRPNNGPNLFHSFRYFSLSSGDVAVFSGSAGINNVLARVTGPDASTINGKIQSTIPGANFFLMNPRGIIFGSGASLDIGGSFVATTADFIRLKDGGHFDAIDQGKAALTVAPPSAFGFLTPTPAAISVSSTDLSVSDGHSISFIGGDVSFENANIDAPNGAIHAISARGPGEVAMDFETANPTPVLAPGTSGGEVRLNTSNLGIAQTTRKVVIRGGKLTTVDSTISATTVESGDGISVRVAEDITATGFNFFASTTRGDSTGQDVIDVVARNMQLSDASVITAFTEGNGAKGDVRLTLSGRLEISGFSGVSNSTGGDVRIEADSMLVSDFGAIVASYSDSPAGDIHIDVAGRLDILGGGLIGVDQSANKSSNIYITAGELFISGILDGQPAGIHATLVGGEDAPGGLIHLDISGRFEMSDGARIQAITTGGNGARVEISAGEMVITNNGFNQDTGIFAENESSPEKSGGSIRIAVRGGLSLLGGAAISTDTSGLGPGGEIEISAQRLVIEGRGIEHGTLSLQGINSRNKTQGESGSSGDIRVTVREGMELFNGAEILTTTFGSGSGGSIFLAGRDVSMTGGSLIASETLAAIGGGQGGNIALNLSGKLSIGGGSQISVATSGSGAAGSIDLRVDELALSGAGSAILAATSSSGRGGDISIAADKVSISGRGRISAETTAAANAGAGGDVKLTVDGDLTIKDGGLVSVESFGPGAGGNIQVRAERLSISDSGSAILATANGSGAGGSISLTGDAAMVAKGGRIAAETLATTGGGPGGNIRMDFGDEIEVRDGGKISVATAGSGQGGSAEVRTDRLVVSGSGSAITAQSLGMPTGGNGGNLAFKLGELSLEDKGAILVSSAGSGRAGTIKIEAARRVVLKSGSSITAAALASSGGEIEINGGARIELKNSRITAEANSKGGNIRLESRDILDVFRSQITAAANTDGGNIFIDPQFVLLNQAIISANAVIGRGGNIRIFSDYFIASPDSLVTASSERGISGEVRINAVNVDLTGNIVDLPVTFIRAESLLRELCTVKLQDFSSFIVEGRGGMAPVPGEWISSLEPELPSKETPKKQ